MAGLPRVALALLVAPGIAAPAPVGQDPGSRPATAPARPPCSITGVVRDPTGAPVKAPVVRLCRLRCEGVPAEALRLEEQEWVEQQRTTGDDQGRFAFPAALGRLYGVWASAGDQASALLAPAIAGDRLDVTIVAPVTARGQVSMLERNGRRRIAPGAVVAARLPVVAARPLASGRGWLFPGPWVEGRADEQGRFALTLPPPAPGIPIVLEARAGERRVRDVLVDVSQAGELVLPAARRPLRLRFLDRALNPVAGVRIVSDHAGGPEATSGSNGIAEVFDDLNALLRALPEEHAMHGLRRQPGPADPPDYFVDVPLGEAVPLTGRLRDERGAPIAGARMCFVSGLANMAGVWARFTTTDTDGTFSAPGLARHRNMQAYVERDGRFVPFLSGRLEHDVDVGDCTVASSGMVLGRLAGPAGQSLAGAELLVVPQVEVVVPARLGGVRVAGAPGAGRWSPRPLWFPVGQDGTFCLPHLPPGPCRLALIAPGLCVAFQQVVLGAQPLVLDVKLQAGVPLTGTVLRHDGSPADFATVTASLTESDQQEYRRFGLPLPSAVTDPRTGRFSLSGVEADTLRALEAVRLPREHARVELDAPRDALELRLSDPATARVERR